MQVSKNKFYSLLLLMLMHTSLLFSISIEQAFINIPDGYVPLLPQKERVELLFGHMHGIDSVNNAFNGISKLDTLDTENAYLRVKITEISHLEQKIWTKKDGSSLIGFSLTVCGPICDSQIAFFNDTYKPENDDSIIPLTSVFDFIDLEKTKEKNINPVDLFEKSDAFFASFSLSPTDNNIFLNIHIDEFLPEEIYEELKQYLKGNKIELVWDNQGFFKKGEVSWK